MHVPASTSAGTCARAGIRIHYRAGTCTRVLNVSRTPNINFNLTLTTHTKAHNLNYCHTRSCTLA